MWTVPSATYTYYACYGSFLAQVTSMHLDANVDPAYATALLFGIDKLEALCFIANDLEDGITIAPLDISGDLSLSCTFARQFKDCELPGHWQSST